MSTPPVLSKATGTCSEYVSACIGDTQTILFYTSLVLIAFGMCGNFSLASFMIEQMPTEAGGHVEAPPKEIASFILSVFAMTLLPGLWVFALSYIKNWSILFGIPAICALVSTLLFLSGTSSYIRVKPQRNSLHRALASKITLRMVPVLMIVIVCGVVLGIGNTFFLEQLNHMNHMLGHLKFPFTLFLYWYYISSSTNFYNTLRSILGETRRKYAAPVGIGIGMILSILCCITAAKVEVRRIDVIERHGLVEKPYDTIPMTIFWLVPQFVLLGAFDGFARQGFQYFFCDQVPVSIKAYMNSFVEAVFGLGIICSILFVYVTDKVSEKGGRQGWFQYTLNKSRLDNYYWTLAALSSITLVLFLVIACCHSYKDGEIEDEQLEV
ncbi:protein NRT1/ PTR FAMILY 5.5-like [Telopea speciosissima]|uniref:protein NRT1/ PTR FAMILY 5.5-like n=1 Tax=Telopea speciosissima TaxID=54955 RepID=UPI001CC335F7|nr:protein NRT1/ PTR FAMILY 5.5-like [Telopea speciosissima]